MRISEIFAIIRIVLSVVPALLEIIQKVRDMWPKKDGETLEQSKERQDARKKSADPRIRAVISKIMHRKPTSEEVALVRDIAHSVEKKVRVGKARR